MKASIYQLAYSCGVTILCKSVLAIFRGKRVVSNNLNCSNSDEGLNRTLQTSYVQQTPTRVQASVYDRKYDTLEVGNASSYVTSRSSTRKKTTIERVNLLRSSSQLYSNCSEIGGSVTFRKLHNIVAFL